ncbi:MAG TPA: hypothetical protein PLV92_06735 [Pirellulaceae bacterium]|nr:hypothetical protein [Pirellulaceae bacterium]
MSATFNKFGVKFLYPENWTITDEQATDWPRSVSIATPDSAFWVLNVYEQGDGAALTAEALRAMREQYPDLEAEPILETIEGAEVVGFDMQFYCLDFVVTARVVSARRGEQTFVVFSQGEDRVYDRAAPVFQAMLVSLLRG